MKITLITSVIYVDYITEIMTFINMSLDDDLFAQVKIMCAIKRKTMKDYIPELIDRGLQEDREKLEKGEFKV